MIISPLQWFSNEKHIDFNTGFFPAQEVQISLYCIHLNVLFQTCKVHNLITAFPKTPK